VLALTTPIGVTNIDPKTTILSKHIAHVIEGPHQRFDVCRRMLLKSNLIFDLVVSLTIEGWGRDYAIGNDSRIN